MMKKYLVSILAIIISLGGIIFVKAGGLYYQDSTSSNANFASTTSSFIVGGTGTTTKTIASDGFEQISWLVALASSTTPPTLCWTNQYSNNGTDWYTEDYSYASTTVHISTEKQECWLYATTTSTNFVSRGSDGLTYYIGRKIVVPNLDTVFTRTIFSINYGVNARLDIRGSLKNEVVKDK